MGFLSSSSLSLIGIPPYPTIILLQCSFDARSLHTSPKVVDAYANTNLKQLEDVISWIARRVSVLPSLSFTQIVSAPEICSRVVSASCNMIDRSNRPDIGHNGKHKLGCMIWMSRDPLLPTFTNSPSNTPIFSAWWALCLYILRTHRVL